MAVSDGSEYASTGSPQYASLLDKYGTNAAPWNVAGVDYRVGVPEGLTLKNPATISGTGVSVNTSSRSITITGNDVTLDGYDFSGWSVVTTAANTSLINSKFDGAKPGGTQSSVISGTSTSSNLYVGYCTIDGKAGGGQGASFLVEMQGPGLIVEYSWLKNSNADLIGRHGRSGGDIVIQNNLLEQAGMGGSGTHGDYLQVYGPTVDSTVILFNTAIQNGGITQGFIADNTKSGEFAGNTLIGSVSYWLSVSGPGTNTANLTGPFSVHDNYFDVSKAYGFNYPHAGPNDSFAMTSFTHNVNMVTGKLVQDSNASTTPWPGPASPEPAPTPPSAPTIASFSNDSGAKGDGVTNDSTLTLTGTAAAGSQVKVFDNGAQIGTATANNSGAWSYTTGTLSNGNHSLTATTTTSAGTSAASSALAVKIDTVAPAAPTIGTPTTGANGNVSLSGSAEANSTVTLYDGGTQIGTTTANGSGAWSFTATNLAQTSHSFTARATDAAGNASTASAAKVVDTTPAPAPTPPSAPTIASFSNDSGAKGDGVTNDNTLTLTGTAAAGSTVKVLDNGAQIGTATANSSGAWSYTTGALSNGNHSLTATTTTSAGTSAASSALAVKIDTVAPAAPTIGTPATGANGNVSLSGTAEANSTVTLYDGGTQIGTTTANGSGAWSFTATNLAQTSHSFTARATDAAGNASTASAAKVVDTTPAPAPTPPSAPTIASFSNDSGAKGDGVTNDNTLTLTGTAAAGSQVKVFDNGAQIGTATANNSGAWSYTTGILSNGNHSLTATTTTSAGTSAASSALAVAGTSAASSALAVKIDTVAPAAPTIGTPTTGANGNVSLSGSAEANSTVTLYDGETQIGTTTANGSGAWSFTATNLAQTSHSFTARATDAAGNASTASAAKVVDTTPAPAPTPPSAPTIASFSNDSGAKGDGVTNDNTLTLTGTAAAGSQVKVFDNGAQIGTATANNSGAWSYTTGILSNGNHSLTATTTTSAGTSAASSALAVKIDTVAPAAPTIGTPTTGANGNVSLSGTAEANSTVTLYDGGTQIGTTTANGSGAWSFTATNLAQTSHSFTARATDAAGNASTASAAKVVDTTPAPAPTPPSAPTIASFSNDSGAKGDGVTNDNTLTLTGTAAAGSTVKVLDNGAQIGTATANSSGAWSYTTGALSNGNHSLTATTTTSAGTSAASSALAVKIDTVAPAAPTIGTPATGANGNVSLSGSAEANSTLTLYDGGNPIGTVTANGSGAWSFTATNVVQGNHSFTARATDVAGNTSAFAAPATINIAPPPSAPTIASFSNDSGAKGDGVTNDNTLTLTGTAAAGSTVKVLDNGAQIGTATANSSGAWSYTTGTLSNGSHSLTATATTSAGTSAASPAGSSGGWSLTRATPPNGEDAFYTTGYHAVYGTSASSDPLTIVVDTLAPVRPVISMLTANDQSVAGTRTSAGEMTLIGTAEAGSLITVTDGTTAIGTTTTGDDGHWSFVASGLTNGTHSFTVRATDAAGNQSGASTAIGVKVDTLAPVKPKIWSYSQDTGVVGDGLTNATSVKLTGTAEAHARVKVYNGDDLIGETVASKKGAWSFTAGTLEHGATYDFKVTATDVAQNTSVASDTLSMTIDKVAPSMPQILSYSPGNEVLGITKSNVITLVGTAEANSTIKLYSGSKYIGKTLADGNGDWSLTTAPLPNATHRFAATATDAAGNTSPLATLVSNGGTARSSAIEDHAVMLVTVDTKAPKQPAVTSFSTDTGKIGDRITSDDTLVLRGRAEAGSFIDVYAGDTLLGSTIADANGAWSFLTDDLQDGAYTFTFKATDLAGNTSAGSRPLHVTVDTHVDAPVILSPGPTGSYSKTSALTIKGNAEAFSAISLYAGETLLGTAKANAQGDWSFRTSKLPDGEYSFSAIATDLAGNESLTSNIATATVDTTTPIRPVITALTANDDVAAGTTINSNAITLTGTAEAGSLVTVTDGKTVVGTATADGAGLWSLTAASLTEGAHRFTVRSTDAAGNQSAVSTAVGIKVDTLAPGQPNHFAATATDAAGNTSPSVSEAGSTVDVYAADVARSGVTLHDGSFDAVFNHALAGDNRDLALLQEFVVSPTMPPDARWWPDEPHHNGFLFLF